jgi:hypothetical protein
MKHVIQEYYDTERNAEIKIKWFFDKGFKIWFGDRINGYEEPVYADTWEEVEEIFRKKLKEM